MLSKSGVTAKFSTSRKFSEKLNKLKFSPAVRGPCIEDLASQNITFGDLYSRGPIDICIDIYELI